LDLDALVDVFRTPTNFPMTLTRRRWLVAVSLVSIALAGCRAHKPPDFVGTWTITEQSRTNFLAKSQQKAAAKITFHTGSTFTATEVPDDLLYGPKNAAQRLISGEGNWHLVIRAGYRPWLQLDFTHIFAGQRNEGPYRTQVYMSSDSTPSLYYFQGDPDGARRVEFTETNGAGGSVSER
jgi:hypothetical protein